MLRIFLAHAKEDEDAVVCLYNKLAAKGYKPWLDKADLLPGQNWRAEIPKAIKNSHVFIACLSKRSVAKHGYVQREFRMALNECANRPPGSIYLIPVRLDECEIPELRQEDYGINLRDYQWVDLFSGDGFERLMQSLVLHFPDEPKGEANPANSMTQPQTTVGLGTQMKRDRLQRQIQVKREQHAREKAKLGGSSGAAEAEIEQTLGRIEGEITQIEAQLQEVGG